MKKKVISVIGLGFVGLPTACILANLKYKSSYYFKVNGVDISDKKIKNIKMNLDTNYEDEKLNKIVKNVIKNDQIQFTTNLKSISASEIILICINFDFNKNNYSENLKNLKKLFIKIGQVIKKEYSNFS